MLMLLGRAWPCPTCCLGGRSAQGVDLRMPRSDAVHGARRRPLVTAVFRPFWHGRGTDASIRDGCQLMAREAVRPLSYDLGFKD